MSDNREVLTDQEVAAMLADLPDLAMPAAVWQRLEEVIAHDVAARAATKECKRRPVQPRMAVKQIAVERGRSRR